MKKITTVNFKDGFHWDGYNFKSSASLPEGEIDFFWDDEGTNLIFATLNRKGHTQIGIPLASVVGFKFVEPYPAGDLELLKKEIRTEFGQNEKTAQGGGKPVKVEAK